MPHHPRLPSNERAPPTPHRICHDRVADERHYGKRRAAAIGARAGRAAPWGNRPGARNRCVDTFRRTLPAIAAARYFPAIRRRTGPRRSAEPDQRDSPPSRAHAAPQPCNTSTARSRRPDSRCASQDARSSATRPTRAASAPFRLPARSAYGDRYRPRSPPVGMIVVSGDTNRRLTRGSAKRCTFPRWRCGDACRRQVPPEHQAAPTRRRLALVACSAVCRSARHQHDAPQARTDNWRGLPRRRYHHGREYCLFTKASIRRRRRTSWNDG
jgi:hypothetical protein